MSACQLFIGHVVHFGGKYTPILLGRTDLSRICTFMTGMLQQIMSAPIFHRQKA